MALVTIAASGWFNSCASVPTYVVEFLLGRYCATTDEKEIEEGLQIVEHLRHFRIDPHRPAQHGQGCVGGYYTEDDVDRLIEAGPEHGGADYSLTVGTGRCFRKPPRSMTATVATRVAGGVPA